MTTSEVYRLITRTSTRSWVDDHDSYRPVKEAEGMSGAWPERRYLQPKVVERWEQKT